MTIKPHQLFVNRWAKIYVDRYVKNPQSAIDWGLKFFPESWIPLIVEASKNELKKRGIVPK